MEDDSVVKVQLEIEIVSARGQVMRTMRGHLPQAEAAEVADQVEEKAAEPQLARADETGVLISNIRDFNKLGLGPKETRYVARTSQKRRYDCAPCLKYRFAVL